MLILISGLPGTGKTRISRELASKLGAVHISSDSIRKKMLEKRTYSEEEKALIYKEMVSRVSKSLSEGKNVIADATFYKESLRKQMREAAEKAGTDFFLVECILSEDAARERISSRTGGDSEAKYGEYLIVKKAFEPIREERITIDTSLPVKESVETILRSISGTASILEELKKPSAYPHPISNLTLLQTHISWVFLTGEYAYKIKKPVKFSFLDFSTREIRKSLCEEEVRLNRRLCPDVYLGVVSLSINGHPSFGGSGFPIDYAVKMKQLPSEKIMSKLLNEGKVTESHIRSIAKIIADFHSRIEIIHDKKYNSPEMIAEQFADLGGVRDTAEKACGMGGKIDFILKKAEEFTRKNNPLFTGRQENGFIRDCHGDLHSGNIFLTDQIAIFDCVEFNKSFRYTDVSADIGFMAMDLDAHGRKDFSQLFISEYVGLTKDEGLRALINYYLCYRANVRAKIAALTYAQHPSEEEKSKIDKYLLLAEEYARHL
ncbi:MAG: AAA family ATPase [Candidatus Micrarchaeota archaeon]|nr:AAA family ATPase [Candidatus Micrarchaeota archaeon]